MFEPNKHVDRETLYNEVWSDPLTTVAPRYGLSDVGLAKICRSMEIPLPSRGYWAKVQSGRIMAKPALPKLKAKYIPNGPVKLPKEQAELRQASRKVASLIRKELASLPRVNDGLSVSKTHPMVVAAGKRLRNRDGWTDKAGLRSAPREVLNISVTKESLDRALGLADELIKSFEKTGVQVTVDSDRGQTCLLWPETKTVLTLSVVEQITRKNHEITPAEQRALDRYHAQPIGFRSMVYPGTPRYDYIQTGRLTVEIGGHRRSRCWNDTPRTQLEARIPEIVSEAAVIANMKHQQAIEDARSEREWRQKLEVYESKITARADERRRFELFESAANEWERAGKLRAYANAVERRYRIDGDLLPEVTEWLAWARAKADWIDPLVDVSDPILDAPEPTKPTRGYWG